MDIVWDKAKSEMLKKTRDISFEEIAQIILDQKYLAVLENPSRPDQMVFVVSYKGYTHVVPFVFDDDDAIVLKTVFPSRKFHAIYGKEQQ